MIVNISGISIIIESNSLLLNKLFEDVGLAERHPVTVCRKLEEGLKLAANKNLNVRQLYLSDLLVTAENYALIEAFKKQHPTLPMILLRHLEDKNPLIEKFDYVLSTPKSYNDLVEYTTKIFAERTNWTATKATAEAKDEEFSCEDQQFVAIPIDEVPVTKQSFFNYHIRLSEKRFVKIINAGDEYVDELDRYKKKGIKDIYLPKAEHEKFIAFLGTIGDKVLSKAGIDHEKKAEIISSYGANIIQNLSQLGISSEKLEHADKFLGQSVQLAKDIKFKKKNLQSFLDGLDKNDHTSTVSLIASLVANETGFESVSSIKHVGLGALLHDIGLFDLAPHLKESDVNKMSDDDYKIFQKHAKHGADLLRNAGGIDESVCIMVEQHHMRRKGEIGKKSLTINISTEIVGVADEFYNTVVISKDKDAKLEHFLKITIKGFSVEIERAFQRLFPEKTKSFKGAS